MIPMVKDGLIDAGYDEIKDNQDAHEILKILFNKKQIINKLTEEIITVPGSTTKLSRKEFGDYMEEIAKWAAEYLGINIPPPGIQMKTF